MTTTTDPTADQIDRRLTEAHVHLEHAARALYGIAPGEDATDDVMAGAYLVVGARAIVISQQLREELRRTS